MAKTPQERLDELAMLQLGIGDDLMDNMECIQNPARDDISKKLITEQSEKLHTISKALYLIIQCIKRSICMECSDEVKIAAMKSQDRCYAMMQKYNMPYR